ncbi:kininogen-1 [Electrophorus electricus]|uniref:kininogen-1 n=1 Tax=Electrophorus electricus TaxID=8005 RepID=UPI0015D047F7|nr:kininogen-1 [Electrophorus electricus]
MKADVLGLLLALTGLFHAGSHGQEDAGLPCSDKTVEDVVHLVLLLHNKDLSEGGQLALYQILEASKAQNDSGDVISVRFTGRETDCPAGGDKVWDQCDYLQDPAKAIRNCQAKVLLKETMEVISSHCSVDLPVVSMQRPPCLGCPINIDIHSEDIKEPLSYSLLKANIMHNHPHFFILNTIYQATRQVIAGFRYQLKFDMQKSNCTKSDFKEVTEECHPDQEAPSFINCNSTVDVAPWRLELPETHVQCAPGPIQSFMFKRPPGWSPLRSVHNLAVHQEPSNKPLKTESSDESNESKAMPTATAPPADPASPARDQDPVLDSVPSTAPITAPSCPSKPWKVFQPVFRGPPPPPSNKTEIGLGAAEPSG